LEVYNDVIHLLQEKFELPIAAYHVSSECAMLLAACEKGDLDYDVVMPETLMHIRRDGTDVIMTIWRSLFGSFIMGGVGSYLVIYSSFK
jgi:porphobilinogen synthase